MPVKRFFMKNFLSLVLAAVIGSLITIGGFQWFNKHGESFRIKDDKADKSSEITYRSDGNSTKAFVDFTNASKRAKDAVVHIRSVQTHVPDQPDGFRFYNIPEPFRDFFGEDLFRQYQQPQQSMASGSGVIVSADGYIVTNNHVIENSDQIEVSLNDNRSYKATVVGSDPSTDLAVIKVKEDDLPAIVIANSDEVQVGEWVLAIGNPFNLTSTVTAGIVSAKGRNLQILKDQSAIESFIQTDAAVNPGNSGGALVNLDGDLIGINTAIASPTGTYAGYAFSVPSNMVKKVIEDILKYGTVQRGYLGVIIRG